MSEQSRLKGVSPLPLPSSCWPAVVGLESTTKRLHFILPEWLKALARTWLPTRRTGPAPTAQARPQFYDGYSENAEAACGQCNDEATRRHASRWLCGEQRSPFTTHLLQDACAPLEPLEHLTVATTVATSCQLVCKRLSRRLSCSKRTSVVMPVLPRCSSAKVNNNVCIVANCPRLNHTRLFCKMQMCCELATQPCSEQG